MPVDDPVFSGDQVRHDEIGIFYEVIKIRTEKKQIKTGKFLVSVARIVNTFVAVHRIDMIMVTRYEL